MIQLILLLITASLFMIAIMNAAAATCFWIVRSGYVMVVMFRFKDYARYPVSIFDGIFKVIFTFVIPIAFIAYYPGIVILRPDEIPLLSKLSPIIGIAFFYLSYKFWMLGDPVDIKVTIDGAVSENRIAEKSDQRVEDLLGQLQVMKLYHHQHG